MLLKPAEINIKNHIIKNPQIFQSRSDVLHYVLLVDSGSSWGKNGTVYSHDISRLNPVNFVLNTGDFPKLNELSIPDQINVQIEWAKYQIIEQYIDTIVSCEMPYEHGVKRSNFSHLNQYSLIFHVPDNIEDSWRKAVLEVVEAVIVANKEAYCKDSRANGDSALDWVYPFAFDNHTKLIDVRNRLTPKIEVSPEVAAKLAGLKKLLG